MIAIKDMAIPSCCGECDFCTDDWCCKIQHKYINNFVPNHINRDPNCPLVEIEPLTDSEQRIFLSAMSREMSICRQIDNDKVDDNTVKKLVPIVNTIERKIKKVLWN